MKYLIMIAIFCTNIMLMSAQEFTVVQQVSGNCRDFYSGIIATSDGVFDIVTGEKLLDIGDIFDMIPDTNYVIGYDGVYDLTTGDNIINLDNVDPRSLSPDNAYFAVNGVGIYDVETWELIIVPERIYFRPLFSPDGKYILLGSDLYDLTTREIVLADVSPGNGISGQFSPRGTFLADPSRGIFNLITWEWVYEDEPFPDDPDVLWVAALGDGVFSPDETLLAMHNGVFSTHTWERIFETESGTDTNRFSADSHYLYIDDDAVYNVNTGQPLFSVWGYGLFTSDSEFFINIDYASRVIEAYDLKDGTLNSSARSDKSLNYRYRLNEDDTLLLIPDNAVFDLATGEKLYDVPRYSRFSQDGKWIVSDDGLVDATTGQVIWDANVIAISDDNAYLAVQEQDKCSIYTFDG